MPQLVWCHDHDAGTITPILNNCHFLRGGESLSVRLFVNSLVWKYPRRRSYVLFSATSLRTRNVKQFAI